jgi:P27 family predicted phage terminase small subunit
VARAEWARVAPELARIGVLTRVDEKALVGYCVNWQRWMEAQTFLADPQSYLYVSKSGYPFPNPFLSIADKAMEQMRKFAVEFGMTPSSRSGIHGNTHNDNEGQNEWEQLEAESTALAVN